MVTKLMSGNHAAIYGAISKSCAHFYGYPITPTNTALEFASDIFPRMHLNFIQAESEVTAISQAIGASAAGETPLTITSGPGLSLMQEGISYARANDLPIVIINSMRGGPGLGNINPAQSDYRLMTKGGGHGEGRTIVLAPNSPQETYDLTRHAFHLAKKYLHPVIVAIDGGISLLEENVTMNELDFSVEYPIRPNSVRGNGERVNLTSVQDPEKLEPILKKRNAKYESMEEESMFDGFQLDTAEIVFVAYGTTSRVVEDYLQRACNPKLGLFRPKTLWPFPRNELKEVRAKKFVSVEGSQGQMKEDLEAILHQPVDLISRTGGNLPTWQDIHNFVGGLNG